ncbi:hypothetical protein BDF19DRAFT_423616 [Syncephalis fuscata]|nr:hypothetical protein BDF19DRAFT_423616 [Syncephalis fuscata]
MNPAKQNKIDLSQFTDEEKAIFRKYGKLPTRDIARNKFQANYELNKAGRQDATVGVQHPSPDKIPHGASTAAASQHLGKTNASAVQRESSLTHEATEEITNAAEAVAAAKKLAAE